MIENLISRNLTPRLYVKTKEELDAEIAEKAEATIETEEPDFEWDDTDVIAPVETNKK